MVGQNRVKRMIEIFLKAYSKKGWNKYCQLTKNELAELKKSNISIPKKLETKE